MCSKRTVLVMLTTATCLLLCQSRWSDAQAPDKNAVSPTIQELQTAKKAGDSAYAYLRDRISRRFELPSLAQSILAAIEAQTTEAARV